MPIYDFECKDCKHKIEVLQKFDDPSPVCENCGAETIRVVSVTAPPRRGAGLYSLDIEAPKRLEWKE
jgi:putative FmdB family regulatory protein